jgi:hypothetical protein
MRDCQDPHPDCRCCPLQIAALQADLRRTRNWVGAVLCCTVLEESISPSTDGDGGICLLKPSIVPVQLDENRDAEGRTLLKCFRYIRD